MNNFKLTVEETTMLLMALQDKIENTNVIKVIVKYEKLKKKLLKQLRG